MSLVSSAFGGVKFTHPAGKFKGMFCEPNAVKFELKNAVNFTKFKILFTLTFCLRLVKFNEFKAAKFALGRAALPAMFAAFFKFNKILPVTLKSEPKKTATNFMYAAQVLLHQNLAQTVKLGSSNLTVNFKILGVFGLVEMAFFIVLLGIGFIYAWKKGALNWQSIR